MVDDRVAVLGATGFLGRVLVPALLATGRRVTMVARRRPSLIPTGANFVACDAGDANALADAVCDIAQIVNAVSGTPAIMVKTARNLCAILGRRSPNETAIGLVHVSSLAVFGQTTGILAEPTIPLPARHHPYGIAKLLAEAILLSEPAISAGCVVLRPGCIYGAGSAVWSDRIGRLLLAKRLGWLGGEGRGRCTIVHVADVAKAIIVALDMGRDIAGMRHLLGPEELSWNDFFSRYGVQLGMPTLSHIGRAQLMAESLVAAPMAKLLASRGRRNPDIITPSMRRLFRSRAVPVSCGAGLLSASNFRVLEDGLAEAARSLFQRDSIAPRLDSADVPTWAAVA
jgi:nucleoside-diphosphate-sugar epimerase